MPQCTECSRQVSYTYERVMGAPDGTCLCPRCTSSMAQHDTLQGMPGR